MNDLWLIFSAAAMAASLAHVLIDYHIGLYGRSSAVMQPWQAGNLLCTSLVYAWWALILGMVYGMSTSGSASALMMAGGWGLLWNGAIGLVVSPPSRAFPYQDITHIANILLGGLASYFIWQNVRAYQDPIDWLMPSIALGVVVVACIVQSIVGVANR